MQIAAGLDRLVENAVRQNQLLERQNQLLQAILEHMERAEQRESVGASG